MTKHNKKPDKITIRDLYPTFSKEQLRIAEENLTKYAQLVWRIYDRLRQDPEAYAKFKARIKDRENGRQSSDDYLF